MAFTPKDWRNATTVTGGGDTSTPLDAQALEDMETRLSDYTDTSVDVVEAARAFVGVPTGSNDTAALDAAIAALPASGGIVVFQQGSYVFPTAPAALTGMRGLVFEGAAIPEIDGDGTGTVLTFTAASAASFFTVKDDARAMVFRQIQFRYSSASYSGHLIDLRNTTGNAAYDVHDITFEHCYFGSSSLTNASSLIRMAQSHSMVFDHCVFAGADTAVIGREVNDPTGYCNVVKFNACRFIDCVSGFVANGGESWDFDNCTFEPLTSGKPGAWIFWPTIKAGSASFNACWFGDEQTAGQPWIAWFGDTLTVQNCFVGLSNAANVFIQLGGNACRVVHVVGNTFLRGFSSSCSIVDINGKTGVVELKIEDNAIDTISVVSGSIKDIQSVTAAASLTLPKQGKFIEVTGNTNITSVGGGWAGREVTLVFTGTPTFTDGSNLKLSANLVATADDTITIVYDGANWFETGRSVN